MELPKELKYIYGFNGETFQPIVIDKSTNGLATLDYSHKEIHGGKHFFCRGFIDLAGSGTYIILFVTSDTKRLSHFTLEIQHELEASITITENVSTDANGTAMAIFNRNRELARINGVEGNTAEMYHTPTNPAGGVVIASDQKGSNQKFGGGGRDEEEIVFAKNYKYLFTVVNIAVQNSLVNWTFDWYEHTDINR